MSRWPLYVRQAKQVIRAANEGFDERRYGFNGIIAGTFAFAAFALTFFFVATPDYPKGQLNPAGYVPFALTGGVFLQYLLGYNFSVAVWVGYIALFGTAIQTGVVMVVYLEDAVARAAAEAMDRLTQGTTLGGLSIKALVEEGRP